MSPVNLPADAVVFFDLFGGVLDRAGTALAPGATRLLAEAGARRFGLFCAAPAVAGPREALDLLKPFGVDGCFAADLILTSAALPIPATDRRAFAVAAALASRDPSGVAFVTADEARARAAREAGLEVLAAESPASPTLLAGEQPQFELLVAGQGPTFALRGRVVTMDEPELIEDGVVVVSRGRIAAVRDAAEGLPAAYAELTPLDTGGTIYPGLLDLHNHFVYNALPLFVVTQAGRYTNRDQWRGSVSPFINRPINTVKATASGSRALARYIEVKALVGGTTAGQGIKTTVNGERRMFRGAMRNVEYPFGEQLPRAESKIFDLKPDVDADLASFRNNLERYRAFFYHLSEGIDDRAHRHFINLRENDLIAESLVGIHALGLAADDLALLGERGAKVVWSPLSNMILYGRTLDLRALLDSGATFAIGCDWSPSGGKNLLEELKAARLEADRQEVDLDNRALVRAVTSDAARVAAWHPQLGTLRPDTLADLLVIRGTAADPYDQLVGARERDVALVVVEGIARYGEAGLMQAAHDAVGISRERLRVDGRPKMLYLYEPESGLDNITYARAQDYLESAFDDLHAFRDRAVEEKETLLAAGLPQPFELELDEGPFGSPPPPADALTLLADPEMVRTLPLDGLAADEPEHWDRLGRQANFENFPGFVESLRGKY